MDARNLTGPAGTGQLSESELRALVTASNSVWTPCSIRFTPVRTANVSSEALGVAYEPKSQADLSRLASALNPKGFEGTDALPFTVAGPWRFYDAGTGLYLTGLGWVFTSPQGKLDRIGAMIDAQRVRQPVAPLLVAHEMAHALSLPHVAEQDNLMGPGGTSKLSPAQCEQARAFARRALSALVVAGR